jgi:TatD DNase family protein
MKLVDTHFHLDLQRDPLAVVAECEARTVYTIAVTNAPSVFPHTRRITAGTKYLRAALGLHPELVATHGSELPELLRMMDQTRYVGEVGLDYVTADADLRAAQRRVFEAALARCAELGGRVITVHSRRAAPDVLGCIGTSFPGTVILHWFSGALRELRAALNAGCYFSVNPAMLRSARGRSLICEMPRARVLTETDGPFVEIEGRRAMPPDAIYAIKGLAALWNTDAAEAATQVFANFRSAVIPTDSSRG